MGGGGDADDQIMISYIPVTGILFSDDVFLLPIYERYAYDRDYVKLSHYIYTVSYTRMYLSMAHMGSQKIPDKKRRVV